MSKYFYSTLIVSFFTIIFAGCSTESSPAEKWYEDECRPVMIIGCHGDIVEFNDGIGQIHTIQAGIIHLITTSKKYRFYKKDEWNNDIRELAIKDLNDIVTIYRTEGDQDAYRAAEARLKSSLERK